MGLISEPPRSALDDKVAKERARHSCLRRLDEFMFCMTLSNQVDAYYHTGSYGDCPKLFARWQTCLRSKVSKPEDAEALLAQERRENTSGKHIFMFRPQYADEALRRYGIETVPNLSSGGGGSSASSSSSSGASSGSSRRGQAEYP